MRWRPRALGPASGRRRARPGRARAARLTAWLAAVASILLVAFGARLGHLAAVQHALCEHGELTHVHFAPSAAARAGDSSSARADAERTDADADAHEHCTSLALHHHLPSVA